MRRLLPLLVLALASVAASKAPAAVLEARRSAVQIVLREDGEYQAICSGAVVELERGPRIVGAGHCVDEKPNGEYFVLDHEKRLLPVALEEYRFAWPKADYAIFHSLTVTNVLPALKVATETCRIGDDVYSWSGPSGFALMLFHGEISGELHLPYEPEGEAEIGGMLYSANLLTAPGASGSVTLNERGEATAILVGGFGLQSKMGGAFFAKLPK